MSQSFPLMTAHANLFKGKKVLLRLDLNVPLLMNRIRSDFRIKTALPTINFLKQMGAKIIIISHLGTGKENESLKPVSDYLSQMMPMIFLNKIRSSQNIEVIDRMNEGEVCILENLRMDEGEIKNDLDFSNYLASLGDYYVNDAFAASHREHASIIGLPKLLPSFAGMRFAEEAAELSRAFEPKHPYLFIMGGRNVANKTNLLNNLKEKADKIFIGGVVANSFLKSKNINIGTSAYDESYSGDIDEIINDEKFLLPQDAVVLSESGTRISDIKDISEHEMIVDIGHETIASLDKIIGESNFIVWNGPLGYYERGFSDASRELLERISGSNAYTVIGGGDTVALIESMDKTSHFGFISTGGGAMLEYLTTGTLPGIEALKETKIEL